MNKNKKFLYMKLIVFIYIVLQVIFGISESKFINELFPVILTIVIVVFIFFHGLLRFGLKQMLIFFLITTVVSWSYENLSILTGFPFGDYHYSDNLGLKVWAVPMVIMPAYFGTGYLSWTIAQIIIGENKNKISGINIFLIPLIASFIMVMWDLSIDPYMSTISGNWEWENGGAYFGVPFENFLGWFLCVFTIYILFALYLKSKENFSPNIITNDKKYWIFAVLMYILLPLFIFIKNFTTTNRTVESLDGKIWWTADIYLVQSLITMFTMWFVAVIAITIISKNNELR